VTFRWKDYAHGNKQRKMTLTAMEFLRRLIQHVLPLGFVRIRYFGFLANRCRSRLILVCRELQGPVDLSPEATAPNSATWVCPRCGSIMLICERFTAEQFARQVAAIDTS
jgi:hypothetical protein